ncbi:hypothetical protein P43SY_005256 [Pythium insidiosum]|uniref:Ubiquitin-like protease family profile domain-containing protein n=1 Tax=Pythium insidiosum TaxID=114742 RepID=A0AAD5LIC5_PYTIN|nr:hypothetical protein P43SY_005256 [Pythium insidiosum]
MPLPTGTPDMSSPLTGTSAMSSPTTGTPDMPSPTTGTPDMSSPTTEPAMPPNAMSMPTRATFTAAIRRDGHDEEFKKALKFVQDAWRKSAVRLSEMRSTFKATRVLSLDNPDKKRTRSSPVSPYKFSPEIEAEIQGFYSDDGVQAIGIPVGFNNRHWCCLYFNKAHRLISTYDSLGGAKTQRVMSILAEKIDTFVPEKLFTVQRVQTPCATSFGAK